MDLTSLESNGPIQPEIIERESRELEDESEPEDEPIEEIPDDPAMLIKLRTILQLYLRVFPEELKEYQRTSFDNLSLEELTSTRAIFDSVLSYNSTMKTIDRTVSSALLGIEQLAIDFNIRCQGLAGILSNDPDYMRDIHIITLKNIDRIPNSAEMRLLLTTGYTMQALHKFNLGQPQLVSNEQAASTSASSVSQLNEQYPSL